MPTQKRHIIAQDNDIAALQLENSDLWPEIRHLKGPRFPAEIFLLVVESARHDKKALSNFSFVCKSWMRVTRHILFARIFLYAQFWDHKGKLILSEPHCTVFPHVQAMGIFFGTMDGSEDSDPSSFTSMDDFLVHMPKFAALRSLKLCEPRQLDLDILVRVMPLAMKRGLRELEIDSRADSNITMPLMTAFLSNFTNLTTFKCCDGYALGSNEPLVPPPSRITKLNIRASTLGSNIPKWFTELHIGVIESFDANFLANLHPVDFKNFIDRFGPSLSEIKLTIQGGEKPVQFLHTQHFVTLRQLKCIELNVLGNAFNWLPEILEQAPPGIERISVHHNLPLSSATVAQWSQLDHTLVGPTLSSLRDFTVVIGIWEDEGKRREEIERLLPRCAKQEILTVKSES
ncbi:hypothetical protein K438DRAFT_1746824 [Mycena galopus ATCC 62051]|nr:hypothetical protein K438DRAFT_1746824 [Mycena galopus ATCC 62051]